MDDGCDDEIGPGLNLVVTLRKKGDEGGEDALTDRKVKSRPVSLDEEEEELNAESDDIGTECLVGKRVDQL